MSDDPTSRILAALERLETELRAEVTRSRHEIMQRVDRVQDTLTAMRDDIGVNMSRADRAHRAADNVRDEMRSLGEIVSGMARQIQRLQSDVRELRGEP